MSIQFIKSTKDFEGYLSSNRYFVANFTALWCGPCQAIKPVIDQIYSDSNGKYSNIEIARVDLDSSRELATRYQVSSIPTFIFFEGGKEYDRVMGANVPEVLKSLDQLNIRASGDESAGRFGKDSMTASEKHNHQYVKDVSKYIPKGFEILNKTIEFPQFQALNVVPLSSRYDPKDLFILDKDLYGSRMFSDADSQMIFYVPLINISKIYSILIKVTRPLNCTSDEELELNEAELKDETQTPSLVKAWPNRSNIITFDDAIDDSNAPFAEEIRSEEGWHELKFKFVRFQSVQNLSLFIDGENEANHTIIEKIILVGVSGDSKEQPKLEKDE